MAEMTETENVRSEVYRNLLVGFHVKMGAQPYQVVKDPEQMVKRTSPTRSDFKSTKTPEQVADYLGSVALLANVARDLETIEDDIIVRQRLEQVNGQIRELLADIWDAGTWQRMHEMPKTGKLTPP